MTEQIPSKASVVQSRFRSNHPEYAEKNRNEACRKYRLAHGIPLDKPVRRWTKRKNAASKENAPGYSSS